MIPTRRFDRELPELLLEASTAPYPDYIDDVLRRTSRTRQRPAWTSPGRWLPMDLAIPGQAARLPMRSLAILALVALLVAALVAVAVGTRRPLPPPFGVADNGVIAYTDGGDVLVVDPDTGDPRRVIAGPEVDSFPFFSPRGDRLAFLRKVDGGRALHVANADGSGIVRLGAPIGELLALEWSPDGSRIALGSLEDGREVLDIVRTDGSGTSRVAIDGQIRDPAWRPGDAAGFVARVHPWTGGADYVMFEADGGNARPLHLPMDPAVDDSPDHAFLAPAWSPDGTRLAYNTADFQSGRPAQRIHIATIDAAGGLIADQRLEYDIRDENEGWALWSPDGARFVVNVGVRGGDFWRVAVANSDGSGRLTYTGPPTSDPQAMEHRWSPDGTVILARFWEEHEAWLLDPGGGPGRQVPWWATTEDAPSWQRTIRG